MSAECSKCGSDLDYYLKCAVCDARAERDEVQRGVEGGAILLRECEAERDEAVKLLRELKGTLVGVEDRKVLDSLDAFLARLGHPEDQAE